jgi:hypothetical protein
VHPKSSRELQDSRRSPSRLNQVDREKGRRNYTLSRAVLCFIRTRRASISSFFIDFDEKAV